MHIPGSTINTYASIDPIGGEEQVHTLYVLFFEPSSDGSGKFLEIHDISSDGSQYYYSGQIVELELPAESNISKSNTYNLLFLANPTYYISDLTTWAQDFEGKTESEVKETRVGITEDPSPTNAPEYTYKPYIQDALMMSGAVEKEGGQEQIVAELTRIMSRFDVMNAAPSDYQLVSVSIWNAFPTQKIWDEKYTDFSLAHIKRLYGVQTDSNKVIGGLYAYENYVAQPQQNDEVTTCLIVGIEYQGQVSYYRINACERGLSQQLIRNYAYTFTILNVKGLGENSEEDAYKSTDNLLNVQVNEWNVDGEGNIVFDGDNILAVSTTTIYFNRLGGNREYTVFTAGEGLLYMSDKQIPSGFTAELKGNVLYVTATESEYDKAGYVTLQFGKLTTTIRIIQIGEMDDYLELSHSSLPIFSSVGGETSDTLVTVTSSGPWTATLYNAQGVFEFGTGGTVLTGDTGDKFEIQTVAPNNDIEAQFAFVHVTLNSNPQISGIVILTQNGIDGFVINPNVTDLLYDADGGELNPSVDYEITVTATDNREWIAELYGAHKQYFEIETTANTIQVKSKGINPETFELSAAVRIYLQDNPSFSKDINITQYAHSLVVESTTFATVNTEGGQTEEIKITATGDWTVTITSSGTEAYFNDNTNSTIITGTADDNGNFRITFPELEEGGVYPEVTLTVTIDGTEITQTFTISQRPITAQVINVQNFGTLYGYLTDNSTILYRTNYVEQLYQSLVNTDWFGEKGTVFCGGTNFIDVAAVPNVNTDIYVLNSFNGTSSQGSQIRDWLDASSNRVILALSDDRTSTMISYLRLDGYVGTGGTGNNTISTSFPRTINTGDEYTMDNNALYDYLFRSGPFTKDGPPIQKDQIRLLPYDASNNYLSQWPSTMIPLMLDETNPDRLILGVDPTLRIIYTGEMDLFGTAGVSSISYTEDGVVYTGQANYNYGPYAEYNLKFLNNLIAWMVNVVIEGDEFTNQFKVN
ncbi:MAG: hypothetical protein LIO65_06715 [Odoribacter sp.]|nr:hypothetical protein [Odoribacter sp.]